MANNSEMINVFGAIQTNKDGIILTPVYLAFKLFVDHMQNNYIEDVKVDCLTYDSKKYGRIPDRKQVPYIECCANIDNDGDNLSIMLINTHISNDIKVNLEIKGFLPQKIGKMISLRSDSPFDYNTIDHRNKIELTEEDINKLNSIISLELPAHSISVLKLTKNK